MGDDKKQSLLVHGMHGLGDCIHQRAIIRALLKRDNSIALETSWPCVYHDLAGDDLRFLRKPVALRTQLKNAARETDKFAPPRPPHHGGRAIQISYNRSQIASLPSHTVLESMFAAAGIREDYAEADFRLPIPPQWALEAHMLREKWKTTKPIMIYRPLVVRPEFRGSGIRNANVDQYAELVAMVRDSFFVVSVADLEPNREWIIGPQLIADVEYNHGELSFDTLAAVFANADVVFTSGGFAAVLGPAVETPTICILGGYEPKSWLADGAKWATYLGIDPMMPCECATSACNRPCTKALDMPRARGATVEFMGKLGISTTAETRPIGEIFTPAPQPPNPGRLAPQPRVMPRVRVGRPSLLAQRRPPIRA
jgi:ADP-heptose:LPS heptosyltransferase